MSYYRYRGGNNGIRRKRLPPRVAARVILEKPQPWTEDPLAVAPEVQSALVALEREHEKRLTQPLESGPGKGPAMVAGARDVIEALWSGRVGPRGHGYLILGPDPREVVARCTACRFVSADMPAACPHCGSPCADANLWEELLLFALRHDVVACCVGADPRLARRGGVAAVLPEKAGPGESGLGWRYP